MIRKLGWGSMTLLAVLVGIYAAALFVPSLRPPFVQNLFANSPSAIAVHLAGGVLAIVIGPFQLSSWLRKRYLTAHRWFGRAYVIAVSAGGVAGLILASQSYGGLVTHFGFGLMAACWLGCTWSAYWHVRAGDIAAHRAWMMRSYALTLAAVTLRIYLPSSMLLGIDFDAAYPAISWLCWVPNLLVVEWFILPRMSRAVTPAG